MVKNITQVDGIWRMGNPSEAPAYIGGPDTVSGGPSHSALICEGVMGSTTRPMFTDVQLDATWGVMLVDSTMVMPGSTTALAGSAGVMTYTIPNTSNPSVVVAGNLVTVAGASPAGYNGTNLLVVSASATQFTVAGAGTGAQTVAGTVTITSGAFRTVYTPATQYDNGVMWTIKKTNNDGNRVAIFPITGTMDGQSSQGYTMGVGQNSTLTIVSDGTKYYAAARYDAPAISATADPLATGGTISPGNLTLKRVNPAAASTGVIMNSTNTVANQECTVFNESAFLITFAAVATSHVANGATTTIPTLTGRRFVWNALATVPAWYAS